MEHSKPIKIRKSWNGISPITRIKQSKKLYSRAVVKQQSRKEQYV